MDDLISRQEAIDMFERLAHDDWNQGVCTTWANAYAEAADMVEELQSVDAVQVVRCGECKHATDWYGNKLLCKFWSEAGIGVFDNGFCSYGERKDE